MGITHGANVNVMFNMATYYFGCQRGFSFYVPVNLINCCAPSNKLTKHAVCFIHCIRTELDVQSLK